METGCPKYVLFYFIHQPENKLEDALNALSGRVKFHPIPMGSEQVPGWKEKLI